MKKVLLLNSTYEPINFITQTHAIRLILRGVVSVEEIWNDETWCSNKLIIQTPAILRLDTYKRPWQPCRRFSARVMFNRDGYTCQYCNHKLSSDAVTIDHIIPKFLGGKTDYKNCVTACKSCNKRKAHRTYDDAGMMLRAEPKFPGRLDYIDCHFRDDWHPSWFAVLPNA